MLELFGYAIVGVVLLFIIAPALAGFGFFLLGVYGSIVGLLKALRILK